MLKHLSFLPSTSPFFSSTTTSSSISHLLQLQKRNQTFIRNLSTSSPPSLFPSSSSSLSSPSGIFIPKSQVIPSCISVSLEIRDVYRAAGILPLSFVPASSSSSSSFIGVLLGKEKKKKGKGGWSEFKGKIDREKDVDLEATALREFDEETKGVWHHLLPTLRQQLLDPTIRGPCVWNGSGKYLMFFTWIPFVSPSTLLQAQHTSSTSPQSYDPTLEKLEFDWIPLSQLWSFLSHVPDSSSFSAEVAEEREEEKEKELHSFFQATLQIPGVQEALAEFANTTPPSLVK